MSEGSGGICTKHGPFDVGAGVCTLCHQDVLIALRAEHEMAEDFERRYKQMSVNFRFLREIVDALHMHLNPPIEHGLTWQERALAVKKAVLAIITSESKLEDDGVRDPENPCLDFQKGERKPSADCETDGHYLCLKCIHRKEDATEEKEANLV